MGVEKGLHDARLTKTNSVDLYRPPALRNQNSEAIVGLNGAASSSNGTASVASTSSVLSSSTTSSSSSTSSSSLTATTTTTNTSISCNNSPTRAGENVSVNAVDNSNAAANHHSSFDNSVTSTNNVAAAAAASAVIPTAAKSSDAAAAAALTTNGQQRTESRQQQQQQQQQQRRERRPDRAVYIPRARRSQTTPPTTTTQQQQQQQAATPITTTTTTIAAAATTTTATSTQQQQQQQQLAITSETNALVSVAQATSNKTDELLHCKNTTLASSRKSKLNASSSSSAAASNINNNNNKERRERVKKSTTITTNKSNKFLESEAEPITTTTEAPQELTETTLIVIPPNEKHNVENSKVSILPTNCDNDQQTLDTRAQTKLTFATPTTEEEPNHIADHIIATNAMNSAKGVIRTGDGDSKTRPSSVVVLDVASAPNLLIEDVVASREKARRSSSKRAPKCDNDAQELQRASKEINRSNRRIIKQTFVSDVLEIPEKLETKVTAARSPPPKQCTPTRSKFVDSATEEDEDEGNNFNEEEDDWETMFDESGECLDPKIIQELTASVGKVKIELPKMDYSAYLTKQSILNEEEFPHVLEVSNFPLEFKNQDLLMVFSQYKESGFDIKWVDDTHALAVFSSSQIAAEVLTMGHPFVVLKPLAEATVESRLKAKKCANSLQPYRPRPATCAALARRLVTGALGMRLKTAAAERENEKRVLREAKERKLLAAKQRDEVWES